MIESLQCPKCGADLDLPEGVTRLKCKFCGSSLELRETASVRALALLQAGVDQINSGVEEIKGHVETVAQHTTALAEARGSARARWQEAYDHSIKRTRRLRAAARLSLFMALLTPLVFVGTSYSSMKFQLEGSTSASIQIVTVLLFLVSAAAAEELYKKVKLRKQEAEQIRQREPF